MDDCNYIDLHSLESPYVSNVMFTYYCLMFIITLFFFRNYTIEVIVGVLLSQWIKVINTTYMLRNLSFDNKMCVYDNNCKIDKISSERKFMLKVTGFFKYWEFGRQLHVDSNGHLIENKECNRMYEDMLIMNKISYMDIVIEMICENWIFYTIIIIITVLATIIYAKLFYTKRYLEEASFGKEDTVIAELSFRDQRQRFENPL